MTATNLQKLMEYRHRLLRQNCPMGDQIVTLQMLEVLGIDFISLVKEAKAGLTKRDDGSSGIKVCGFWIVGSIPGWSTKA